MTKKMRLTLTRPIKKTSKQKVLKEIRIINRPKKDLDNSINGNNIQSLDNKTLNNESLNNSINQSIKNSINEFLNESVKKSLNESLTNKSKQNKNLENLCNKHTKSFKVIQKYFLFKTNYLSKLDYLDSNMEKIYEFAFFYHFYKIKNLKIYLKRSGINEKIFRKALIEVKNNYKGDDFEEKKEFEKIINLYKINI
ncbi:hypothetical protein DMUE_2798 [Dictyocoela muelleri]|nr:hypothetical protein DMUE_2798 [Dictyocoela muelleri]